MSLSISPFYQPFYKDLQKILEEEEELNHSGIKFSLSCGHEFTEVEIKEICSTNVLFKIQSLNNLYNIPNEDSILLDPKKADLIEKFQIINNLKIKEQAAEITATELFYVHILLFQINSIHPEIFKNNCHICHNPVFCTVSDLTMKKIKDLLDKNYKSPIPSEFLPTQNYCKVYPTHFGKSGRFTLSPKQKNKQSLLLTSSTKTSSVVTILFSTKQDKTFPAANSIELTLTLNCRTKLDLDNIISYLGKKNIPFKKKGLEISITEKNERIIKENWHLNPNPEAQYRKIAELWAIMGLVNHLPPFQKILQNPASLSEYQEIASMASLVPPLERVPSECEERDSKERDSLSIDPELSQESFFTSSSCSTPSQSSITPRIRRNSLTGSPQKLTLEKTGFLSLFSLGK